MIETWIETWVMAVAAGMLISIATGIGTALLVTRTGKERRQDLKAEIETLEKTLEGMHREAGDLRRETSELKTISEEADRIRSEHAALGKRKEEVEAWSREEIRKLDEIEAKRRATKASMDEAARLQDEVATLNARRARLEDEIKDAAEALKEAAKAKGEMEAARAKLNAVETELESVRAKTDRAVKAQDAAQLRRDIAEDRLKKAEERRHRAETAATNAVERRATAAEDLAEQQRECEKVREGVNQLRKDKEVAERQLDEVKLTAASLQDEVEKLQALRERLEEEVKNAVGAREEASRAKGQVEVVRARLHAAEGELESVRAKTDRAIRAQEVADKGLEHAVARRQAAEELCRKAEEAAAVANEMKTAAAADLAEQQREHEEVRLSTDQLRKEKEDNQRRLEALRKEERSLEIRRDMLKKDLEGLRSALGSGSGEIDTGDRKGNLTEPPYLQYGQGAEAAAPMGEREKLEQAIDSIKEQGLRFRDRVVHRFHTALKVSRISPLTVLAGISGTGKTKLPIAYSQAMGIECLVVPVQPRWDGPRDLLGHFDFLHRRFQATELARLLYDYTHTERDTEGQTGSYRLVDDDDRMAIVLLDEMNLARTEYYFSEFLSRLELQGKEDEVTGLRIHKNRMVDLDIPYLEEKDAVRVFPTQRILWVGTMNEDESTMTLSDKVIDRANVLRFARPTEMIRKDGAVIGRGDNEGPPNNYLSARDWNDWCKGTRPIVGTKELIEEINGKVMEPCGRSFGHRMREAMVKYVEVYTGRDWKEGLADQIEMRLLPKLQGVDAQMDEAGDAIAQLAQICEEKLEDSAMAESIRRARTEMQQTGTFNWKGRELP